MTERRPTTNDQLLPCEARTTLRWVLPVAQKRYIWVGINSRVVHDAGASCSAAQEGAVSLKLTAPYDFAITKTASHRTA